METYMMQWLKTAADKKKVRGDLSTGFCPITGKSYGSGMQICCLDHNHDDAKIRGVISSAANLFLGRVEKYYYKLLGKTGVPLEEILANLSKYLYDSKKLDLPYLHYEVIESEKKRITRWKKETIYNKIIIKGLDLRAESAYTKVQLIDLYLDLFKKELEENVKV